MDYDADGTLDFISGCYDPGDIYWFRGLGGGKYERGKFLSDEAGVPLVHHPEERALSNRLALETSGDSEESIMARVASFGSWPAMVDWDQDGDLDMLIGSFAGRLFLRLNEGSRAEPIFASEAIVVEVEGKPLAVDGHANPVVADWDGDGRWDLVVSAANGSVTWFRNVSAGKQPQLESGRILVSAKADSKFLTQVVRPGESPKPGVRAQICVTDFDLDGRLDLLLGDYSHVVRLVSEDRDILEAYQALESKKERVLELLKDASEPEEKRELRRQLKVLTKWQEPYVEGDPEGRIMSFLWLYRRKPAMNANPLPASVGDKSPSSGGETSEDA